MLIGRVRAASVLLTLMVMGAFSLFLHTPEAEAYHAVCTVGGRVPQNIFEHYGVVGKGWMYCPQPGAEFQITVHVQRHVWWVFWTTLGTNWDGTVSDDVVGAEAVGSCGGTGTHTYRTIVDWQVKYYIPVEHESRSGTGVTASVTLPCLDGPLPIVGDT